MLSYTCRINWLVFALGLRCANNLLCCSGRKLKYKTKDPPLVPIELSGSLQTHIEPDNLTQVLFFSSS